MDEAPDDIFRQMDAMMTHLLAQMGWQFASGISPQVRGYRIIIRGGRMPAGEPHDTVIQPQNPHAPLPEVHRIGDEVKVVTELSGADRESIRLKVQGTALVIDADRKGQHHHQTATLPAVNPASMRSSFKNGVLEVSFDALPDEPAKEQKEG